MSVDTKLHMKRLTERLMQMNAVAIAVSGGIDSLTLAAVAESVNDLDVELFHAVSPAVPPEATERTKKLAIDRGWRLNVIDAGEFLDEDYLANPVNRCFFCKTNLYDSIASRTNRQILSGANLDDIGDYRPGLNAAEKAQVRHPFVESQISKRIVRDIAALVGLGHLADLPASPCLSSRVETGIRIDSRVLPLINNAERCVKEYLGGNPSAVRCRVRSTGITIELDANTLDGLDDLAKGQLMDQVKQIFSDNELSNKVSIDYYSVGSAFIHVKPSSTTEVA